MKPIIPPLHAVRAFESAGRHLSFTLAAQELHVTQGAISRHIRTLEQYLGTPVFHRKHRRIELTKAGKVFLAAVERGLYEISTTTSLLVGTATQRVITVSAFPTISFMWLMPRLASFATINPEIQIRVISTDPPMEITESPIESQPNRIDAKISLGQLPGKRYLTSQPRTGYEITSNWRNVNIDLMFEERLVAVAAHGLLDEKPIKGIADLEHHTLIHATARPYAWPDWLRANGASGLRSQHNLSVAHLFTALHLASSGAGVALVPSTTLYSYEGKNGLACIRGNAIPSAGEYYLLTHDGNNDWPELQTFRTWLLDEAKNLNENAQKHLELFER